MTLHTLLLAVQSTGLAATQMFEPLQVLGAA
jgi:hypothetical protein